MSACVKKAKPKSASTLYANYLLAAILSSDDLSTIRLCLSCKAKGLDLCEVSKSDSSWYAEYVYTKRLNCNVLGVSPA